MSHPVPRSPLPSRYAAWQRRLADAFFDGRKQQPVVLFVDRGELRRLAPPEEDGPRSLASAVSEVVDLDLGNKMFARAVGLQSRWAQSVADTPPPTLPVLALSVLAASEMRRDGEHSSNSYYIRLAQALLPTGTDDDIQVARRRLREQGAFLDVADMWKCLDAWMKSNNGAFGISTIRGHDREVRRGFPLSQTLLRTSDRAALTRFFSKADVGRGPVSSGDRLVTMLRRWISGRSHGLSSRLVNALDDPDLLAFVGPLLHDFAASWDGKVVTAEGQRRIDVRLVLHLHDGYAEWAIPTTKGVDGDVLKGRVGGESFEAAIARDPHTDIYLVEGALPPVTAALLSGGFTARGRTCLAEYQPVNVLPLVEDPDTGGWASVDAIRPYEEHVLVASAAASDTVARVLADAADTGWVALPAVFAKRALGVGYSIFEHVTFSDGERLLTAIAALPGTSATGLRVGAPLRPKLVNGLPLMKGVAKNLYLAGGEPDLALPLQEDGGKVAILLDDEIDDLTPSAYPFPLRTLGGGFALGAHTVDADGDKLTFEVALASDDDRTKPGLGALGWTNGELHPAESDLVGVCVRDAAVERPLLARYGSAEIWLLHRTGQLVKVSEPPRPTCLPGLNFSRFEVDPQGAAWMAERRPFGWSVTRLKVQEPNFRPLDAEARRVWSELFATYSTDDSIWKLYHRAWDGRRAR